MYFYEVKKRGVYLSIILKKVFESIILNKMDKKRKAIDDSLLSREVFY